MPRRISLDYDRRVGLRLPSAIFRQSGRLRRDGNSSPACHGGLLHSHCEELPGQFRPVRVIFLGSRTDEFSGTRVRRHFGVVGSVPASVEKKNRFHHDMIFRGIVLTSVPEWIYSVMPQSELEVKKQAVIQERLSKLAAMDSEIAKTLEMKAHGSSPEHWKSILMAGFCLTKGVLLNYSAVM